MIWLGLAVLVGLGTQTETSAALGVTPFADGRDPPPYRGLDPAESAQVSLGQSVFNTVWAPARTPGVARSGLGPLFNAAACAACHVGAARGRGPAGDGAAPIALVIQLQTPASPGGAEADGDPVYGRVLNTAALDGVQAEGSVTVRYRETAGQYYPDGTRWQMRVPHYQLSGLSHGPLAPRTIIKPRLAPALFGAGLLEAVPATALGDSPAPGRFGWQSESLSIRDQATKAFAREMGLTTGERPRDDCTAAEQDCLQQPDGGTPEVPEPLLQALVAFVRMLAVPPSPRHDERLAAAGARLFATTGCAACHRPQLPVELPDAGGTRSHAVIAPYTDLRLHDLGMEMADENAAAVRVPSRWRTAPLWGLGYRMTTEAHPTFLHDGRARSPEEAILWHSGEAAPARRNFMNLWGRPRETLLHWLETL